MRNLVVLAFVTLDGIIQAPGGPEEDTEGGFKYGGWMTGFGDSFIMNVMAEQMAGHMISCSAGRPTKYSRHIGPM